MATSGTWSWSLAGDDMLAEAWERCGKAADTLNGTVIRSALRSIQLMLVEWSNAGLNLWQVDQQSGAVAPGAPTLTTTTATTDVLEAFVTIGGVNRPLAPISRDEYAAIPVPSTQSSAPTQYWIERINPTPIIHLYPVPSSAITLVYNRVRLPQDFSAVAQTADAPILWMDAACAGLAARLALKFAPDRLQLLQPMAAAAFAIAAAENRERVPLTILPDMFA